MAKCILPCFFLSNYKHTEKSPFLLFQKLLNFWEHSLHTPVEGRGVRACVCVRVCLNARLGRDCFCRYCKYEYHFNKACTIPNVLSDFM